MSLYARGLRNKNPFNIKYSNAQKWQGQVRSDGTFVVFDNLDHGVRAAIKLLFNYIRWYDCHTIREIISRFAPASENRTDRYEEFIIMRINNPDVVFNYEKLDFFTFFNLLRLIIRYECGLTYAEVLNYGFTDEYFYRIIKKFKLYEKEKLA